MPNSDVPEQLSLPEKPIRKRERKTDELKGSRWAGFLLLLLTVLISLLFALKGQFARKGIQGIFGTQTYRFEK